MGRKMTRTRQNMFVDYKRDTRHLSAERSEGSALVCSQRDTADASLRSA
jgi:hypothetical protein